MFLRLAVLLWFFATGASVLGWSEWSGVAHGALIHAQGHFLVFWLVLTAVAAGRRWLRLAVWAGCFATAHLWVYGGPWRASLPEPPAEAVSFSVLWANCWGRPEVVGAVHQQALELGVDAVALCQAGGLPALRRLAGDFPHCVTEESDRIALYSRVAILDSQWLRVDGEAAELRPPPRAWLRADLEVASGQTLELWVGHVPTPSHAAHAAGMDFFRESVAHFDRERGDRPMVAVGDWNTTPWSAQYRSLLAAGWVDARSGQWPKRTWRRPSEPWLRWPIDHGFVRGGVGVAQAEVLPDLGSDHYPVLFRLLVPKR